MTSHDPEPALGPAEAPAKPTNEEIKQAASESVRGGVDIRAKIHDVTLLALRSRRFDRHGMQEVVRAVTGGVALGAEDSRADLRKALAEAFRGMDQALTRSAEAGRTALSQLVVTGRDLSDTEIKQALATMKKLEDDFLSTASHAAEAASAKVQPELQRVLDAARESGTETGKMAATSFTELTQRFSVASFDVALAGLEAATVVGSRFAQLAGGILSAIADVLAEPRPPKKPR
jgi:Family of unknown function (DUF6781)